VTPPATVSVIIPTYNRSEVVRRTLECLAAQDHPASDAEILVCDNSSDDTPEMVRELAAASAVPIRLLSSDERLPAVKRNHGLRAASGDLVIFMNDDVWVRPDFFRAHLDAHAAHEGPVAVLGHVEQSGEMEPTPFVEWYRPFSYDELEGRAGQDLDYRYSWSMNLSFPRRVLLERNLVFHEDWANIGHEDVELGWRWTRAGYPIVYEPRAWGEHFHPHDLVSACALQESVGRGLRDLEVLVPDDGLLERYGVFSWHNSPRGVVRGLVRRALFNRYSVPPLTRRLARQPSRSPVAEWTYWKVMLHHTNRGYMAQGRRSPTPVPTLDAVEERA
jgi:glycosyltransferase involved in cell wall biosynthesis